MKLEPFDLNKVHAMTHNIVTRNGTVCMLKGYAGTNYFGEQLMKIDVWNNTFQRFIPFDIPVSGKFGQMYGNPVENGLDLFLVEINPAKPKLDFSKFRDIAISAKRKEEKLRSDWGVYS